MISRRQTEIIHDSILYNSSREEIFDYWEAITQGRVSNCSACRRSIYHLRWWILRSGERMWLWRRLWQQIDWWQTFWSYDSCLAGFCYGPRSTTPRKFIRQPHLSPIVILLSSLVVCYFERASSKQQLTITCNIHKEK